MLIPKASWFWNNFEHLADPVQDKSPEDKSSFLMECSWIWTSNSSISFEVVYGNTVLHGIQYFLVGLEINSKAALLNSNWSTGSKKSENIFNKF